MLDNKVDYLEQTIECEEHAVKSAQMFETDAQGNTVAAGGLIVSREGVLVAGGTEVDIGFVFGEGETFKSSPMELSATLLCKSADGQAIRVCNGGRLTAGDKFKVYFETSTKAHVYIYMYNRSGQFHVFAPTGQAPYRTDAGQETMFPPNDSWVVLDDVGNVNERVNLIVSSYPIKELEQMRGATTDSANGKEVYARAMELRNKLDPILTMESEPGKLSVVEVSGTKQSTLPLVIKSNDIAGVEFEFFHE